MMLYNNHYNFRRDKLSVKHLSEYLFPEIWIGPKVCHAEIFGKKYFF